MIKSIDFKIKEFENLKKYPKELYYIGDTSLLNKRKISIVGTRKPNQYTVQYTQLIASELSKLGIVIVSGGAMGVDAIAHNAAGKNTIMVAGTSLDIRYPAVNRNLIKNIEENSLVISQFKATTTATRYTFPLRNELVVALGEILIVTQADLNSGTLRSVEYAMKQGKDIYVIPHRINESLGTNKLIEEGKVKVIYDLDKFFDNFRLTQTSKNDKDEFLTFCLENPLYDDIVIKYPSEVFEYELLGKIEIKHGKVFVL